MENINCDHCKPAIESVESNKEVISQVNVETQCVPDRRASRRKCRCDRDEVLGDQSSLLFFFLILVCIVCESDCDISMETLLWFFLLLVALFNLNNY
ncbi:MAG: hypothetical protein PHE29_14900 [Tissierellia bacterium]|nr:hypothetical protein [Tissierellia bacterium]